VYRHRYILSNIRKYPTQQTGVEKVFTRCQDLHLKPALVCQTQSKYAEEKPLNSIEEEKKGKWDPDLLLLPIGLQKRGDEAVEKGNAAFSLAIPIARPLLASSFSNVSEQWTGGKNDGAWY
jgi:hypothetical protein